MGKTTSNEATVKRGTRLVRREYATVVSRTRDGGVWVRRDDGCPQWIPPRQLGSAWVKLRRMVPRGR